MMTLGRVLVCLALANVGQQNTEAAHAAAVSKSQAAHAKLRTIQRQLSSVESTMHSDLDSFLHLSDSLDEKDAREGPGLPDMMADGSAPPSSFLQTGGKPSLVQEKQAQGDKAKSAAAHKQLAQVQKQLAAVNAKMQADMENVMAISRDQDEEDLKDEMHEPAAPSSFVETGRKHIFNHESHGLEVAEDKVHAAEEQLRRMKQEFDQGPDLHFPKVEVSQDLRDASGSSFVQRKQQDPEVGRHALHAFGTGPSSRGGRPTEDFNTDPDAVDDGSMKEEHKEAREFVHHLQGLMHHAKKEREEYNQRREEEEGDDSGDDASSLLQADTKRARAQGLHKSIMSTARTLDFMKTLLEAGVDAGVASPSAKEKLEQGEARERKWEKESRAKLEARQQKFDRELNIQMGVKADP